MKYCFNCGFQLEDDALFCNSCGAKQEYEENKEPKDQEILEVQKKAFMKTFVIGIIVLLIIILLSVLITTLIILGE